jgi:hypothetical protein
MSGLCQAVSEFIYEGKNSLTYIQRRKAKLSNRVVSFSIDEIEKLYFTDSNFFCKGQNGIKVTGWTIRYFRGFWLIVTFMQIGD